MDCSKMEFAKNRQFLRIKSESGSEDVYYPLLYKGLPEEAKLYAQLELNETEDNKAEGIRKLKEFMKSKNLICPDDNLLILVLRCCKYDIPKSESKLKRFLKTRQLIINHISRMDMETIGNILDECSSVPFPWRDKNGAIIWHNKQSDSLDKYETDDVVFCSFAEALFMLQFPLSSVYGVDSIIDQEAKRYKYFFNLNVCRKSMLLLLDMPYRLNRIDLINGNFLSYCCYKILYPILPGKFKKRLMHHDTDLKTLHQFYHPDLLPENLGGTLGPISISHYRAECLMFIERLRRENLNSTDM